MMDPELLTALGAAISIFLSAAGSAVASAHAGLFAVRSHGPRAFLPIIISGVLAIYGIIVAVLLCGKLTQESSMTSVDGYRNLAAGLSVGLACCASGCGLASFIHKINEEHRLAVHARSTSEMTEPLVPSFAPDKPKYVYVILSLVFLEAIGLYGLIVALILMG